MTGLKLYSTFKHSHCRLVCNFSQLQAFTLLVFKFSRTQCVAFAHQFSSDTSKENVKSQKKYLKYVIKAIIFNRSICNINSTGYITNLV